MTTRHPIPPIRSSVPATAPATGVPPRWTWSKTITPWLAVALAGLVWAGCDCPSGTTRCGNYCIDVSDSRLHCGACGNECAPNESCVDGHCIPPVPSCDGLGSCPEPTPSSCGLPGQPCCPSGPPCQSSSTARIGCVETSQGTHICAPCGETAQPCCDPATHGSSCFGDFPAPTCCNVDAGPYPRLCIELGAGGSCP